MRLNDILPAALVIVVAVIGVSIGATVLANIRDTQTVDSEEYNLTAAGLSALGEFGNWWSVIVIVVIAVIVIGLVLLLAQNRGA